MNKTRNASVYQSVENWVFLYFQRKMLVVLALGFASGLPLALTGSTLTARLSIEGIDKTTIGLFGAVATPYAFKFLWAPLIDSLPLPFFTALLGRRRGWLVALQALLMAAIMGLGLYPPSESPWLCAGLALIVAILSASQDIVIDAYRVELLPLDKQAAGAGAVVLGYRLGMIASAAGALYLAATIGWPQTYVIMGLLLIVGMLAALIGGEPKVAADIRPTIGGDWFKQSVIAPFADYMTRPHWLAILLFVLLYKLCDAFLGTMTQPFLLELGFDLKQIATVVKLYGVIATIGGSLIGGALAARIGIMHTLFIGGILQAVSNLVFILLARAGADISMLELSITVDNISGGIGTAAFVAYLSSLCHARFTATQYALLSSFSAAGRTWLSTPSGYVAKHLGWEWFFVFATLLGIPGLVLLAWLRKKEVVESPLPLRERVG